LEANELYETFLSYCQDYNIEYGNIVIKNNKNIFILFKPNNNNYIMFERRIGSARESGFCYNIDEIIALAKNTIGEDKIKVKRKEYKNDFYS